MNKLCILLFLAVLSNAAFGYRHRRQADRPSTEDLEDRYGWNRPNFYPWQRPNNPYPSDMYPFPNPNPNPFPTPNRPTVPQPTPTQAPNNGGASTEDPGIRDCRRTCPTTSEYNPVCGSDGTTYDNPGRLTCAQMCGVAVTLLRASRCPATTPAPTL